MQNTLMHQIFCFKQQMSKTVSDKYMRYENRKLDMPNAYPVRNCN